MRSRLSALHPENFHNLKKIETSLFTVSLDETEPQNNSEASLLQDTVLSNLVVSNLIRYGKQYPRKRDVENEKHNKISNVHVYAWHRIRCFKYKNIKQNYSILENIMANCIQNFFKDFRENKFNV